MTTEVWGYADSRHSEIWFGSYATRDEAIAAGQRYCIENELTELFWVQRGEYPDITSCYTDLAEWIIETAEENAGELVPSDEECIDLKAGAEQALKRFLGDWAKEYAKAARWNAVGYPEPVPVTP